MATSRGNRSRGLTRVPERTPQEQGLWPNARVATDQVSEPGYGHSSGVCPTLCSRAFVFHESSATDQGEVCSSGFN